MSSNLVLLPYSYFADPDIGRPLFGGFVYVGEPDLDPESFPISVFYIEENGNEVPAPNPVPIGKGGIIIYNGKPVQIGVNQNYSMRVRDKKLNEKYNVPNNDATGGATQGFVKEQDNNRQKEITGLSDITDASIGLDLFPLIGQGLRIDGVGLWVVTSVTADGTPMPTPAELQTIPDSNGDCTVTGGIAVKLEPWLTVVREVQFGFDGEILNHANFTRKKDLAKTLGVPLVLKGGQSYDMGNNHVIVDLYDETIECRNGKAFLEWTSAPATRALSIVGKYPRSNIQAYNERENGVRDVLKNIALKGNESNPYSKVGFTVGDGTNVTSLFRVVNLSVTGFRWWGEFLDNTWAFVLDHLTTKHGGLLTPSAPEDYGENITIITPFIADSVGEKLEFNRGEYTFTGGSIDNIEIVTNNDSTVKWVNGHLENPGSTATDKTYVTCNDQSSFSAPDLEVVINDPGATITEPWFFCEDGNLNGINLNGCSYTHHGYYRPDQGVTAQLSIAGGGGRVVCDHANINAYGNFQYIPVSPNIGIQNGNFEAGANIEWVKSGTGVLITDSVVFKLGSKSAKFESSPTDNVTIVNSLPCSFGNKISGGLWVKTDLQSNGQFQGKLTFRDKSGTVVQDGVSFFSVNADIDWTWYRLGGAVPYGASSVDVVLEQQFTGVSGTSTGWADGVILNEL